MPLGGSYNDSFITLICQGVRYRFSPSWAPIGSGGMGIVYLGFRISDNKKVAVKMLRPEFTSSYLLRQRAKLEASIQLSHPNLIRMLGFPYTEHMNRYVTGLPERERIPRVVKDFLPILDAVEYMHSLGIIHRDIKPDNLMFENGETMKLMDLGVAKADFFFDAHLKGTIGTPPFCAPEQVVDPGIEASTDTRSDLYSLGMTLSYLIESLFPADSSAIPQELSQILDIATARYPADRFQQVSHFRDKLNQWLDSLSRRSLSSFWKKIRTFSIVYLLVFYPLLSR